MTSVDVLPMTNVSTNNNESPKEKPRKHSKLWQSYQWWYEVTELRKRHLLRISAIKRGVSKRDVQFEYDMMETVAIDQLVNLTKKTMINYGKLVGPVWDWTTSIKGLGAGALAAQLLAQIDDIENCPTVASLWRYAGFAVIDGKAEHNQKGQKSTFNRKLKGICFNIADQFIKQQTPGYVDIYYYHKERYRQLNPGAICNECQIVTDFKWASKQMCPNTESHKVKSGVCLRCGIPSVKQEYKKHFCPNNGKHKVDFTDAHLHNRAWRKMVKAFLRDLWVAWKQFEGHDVEVITEWDKG